MDWDLIIVATTFLSLGGMGYNLARRWMDRAHVSKRELEAIDERLARIEQAVESMAIEVERVSEGQRYTTRLLAGGESVRARD